MEAKMAAVRAAAEHPVDPATGRPFFQPAIGRAPHYRRNQKGLPVGDYLYGMRSAPCPCCLQCSIACLHNTITSGSVVDEHRNSKMRVLTP